MQSPPFPRYLVPPRSKYSPPHRVPKHPQLPFLPQCQWPSFTPIQNNGQNYIIIIIIIIRYGCLLSQAFSSWYFSWTSDDPHCSGFKLHTAVLSVLCVMFQVYLSFVVNLLLLLLLLLFLKLDHDGSFPNSSIPSTVSLLPIGHYLIRCEAVTVTAHKQHSAQSFTLWRSLSWAERKKRGKLQQADTACSLQ